MNTNSLAYFPLSVSVRRQRQRPAISTNFTKYPVTWQKLVTFDERADVCESVLRFALAFVLLSSMATAAFL